MSAYSCTYSPSSDLTFDYILRLQHEPSKLALSCEVPVGFPTFLTVAVKLKAEEMLNSLVADWEKENNANKS